jgi:NitT/TauT family transport system substrate-binding protein
MKIFRALAGLAVLCVALTGLAQNLTEVKYQLAWIANPADAPVLMAVEKGYYKDAGININWSSGKGAFSTVQVVGSGAAQFGTADASAVLRGIASGIPVIAVATFLQTTPSAIIAAPNIKTPKDLEGKKLAMVSTSATARMFPAFAKVTGIDMGKIEIIEASQATQMPMFLSGKVDALDGYVIGEWVEVQRLGKPASLIKWSDYGFNVYGNVMLVNRDYAAANQELVRKVVKATLAGMKYSLANHKEAIDVTKKDSAASREVLAGQWKEISALMENKDTARFGVGWMTRDGWENVQRLSMQYGGQKAEVPLDRVYTTRFLE